MKVFITGGAGFIGSHLADRLLERGDEVLVIDDYATGRRDNLTAQANLTVVEGSIADEALVGRLLEDFRPDQVVHAAASYKDPDDWSGDVTTNVLGTANVVKAAKQVGVGRFIYFQTALCYGLEPLEQPITLDHPIRPEGSSYSISKTAAEQYIQLSGLDYISFRLANMYGPRNLSGPLPTFYQRLSEGKPCFVMDTRRDFIFIHDAIDLVEMALDGKGQTGVYHISSGKDYSIKELFDDAVAAMDITLDEPVEERPRSPDDVYSILIDPSRTIEDFRWEPTSPLEAGILPTIDWYRENGISQTFTHLRQPDSSD